jgi:hypothetical protein
MLGYDNQCARGGEKSRLRLFNTCVEQVLNVLNTVKAARVFNT